MDFISRFPFQGKLAAQVIIWFLLALTVECLVLIMPTRWSYSFDFFLAIIIINNNNNRTFFSLQVKCIGLKKGKMLSFVHEPYIFFFTAIHRHFISSQIISYNSLLCFDSFFPRYKVDAFYNSLPKPTLKSSTHPKSFPNLLCTLATFCSSVKHIQSDAVIWPHLLSQRTR